MVNYDENNPQSIAKFILSNLPRHKHIALATSSQDGSPWVVCVGAVYDDKINFIWRSKTNTEHSKNIINKPEVSVCVFSKTPEVGDFGFYCMAEVREINDESELKEFLPIFFAGKELPAADDLLGDSPARLYCAEIKKAWVTDDRHLKTQVDMDVLRQLAKEGQA